MYLLLIRTIHLFSFFDVHDQKFSVIAQDPERKEGVPVLDPVTATEGVPELLADLAPVLLTDADEGLALTLETNIEVVRGLGADAGADLDPGVVEEAGLGISVGAGLALEINGELAHGQRIVADSALDLLRGAGVDHGLETSTGITPIQSASVEVDPSRPMNVGVALRHLQMTAEVLNLPHHLDVIGSPCLPRREGRSQALLPCDEATCAPEVTPVMTGVGQGPARGNTGVPLPPRKWSRRCQAKWRRSGIDLVLLGVETSMRMRLVPITTERLVQNRRMVAMTEGTITHSY